MKTKQITINGKPLTISELPLKKYVQVLKRLDNIPKALSKLEGLENDKLLELIPNLITEAYPDLVLIVSIATDLPKEDDEELGLNDFTDIIVSLIEVNNYQEVFKKLKKKLNQGKA